MIRFLTFANMLNEMILKIGPWVFWALRSADPNVAVFSLMTINLPIVLVISQINDFFSDTIGYGLSIAVQSICLWSVFSPTGVENVIVKALLFHGVRLTLYLYLRDMDGWKPYDPNKALPRLLRIPESICLSSFFVILTSPALYLLRSPHQSGSITRTGTMQSGGDFFFFSCIGAIMAWCGTILETVADLQKFDVKQKYHRRGMLGSKCSRTVFHGPTEGPYRWCRHPNYLGELIIWTGVWLSGLPSFYKSLLSFTIASTGLISMYLIILQVATKHTEKLQADKYSGQEAYEEWKKQVPAVTLPLLMSPRVKDVLLEYFGSHSRSNKSRIR